uniref:Uncharacterized protein n=1 Tax=Panagrellus redivivus TaxID=6233 RepID=A0A7E4V7F6_PANRE
MTPVVTSTFEASVVGSTGRFSSRFFIFRSTSSRNCFLGSIGSILAFGVVCVCHCYCFINWSSDGCLSLDSAASGAAIGASEASVDWLTLSAMVELETVDGVVASLTTLASVDSGPEEVVAEASVL